MADESEAQPSESEKRNASIASALCDMRRLFRRALSDGKLPQERVQDISEQFAYLGSLSAQGFSSEDEVKLWKTYADLVRFASPATAAGLRTAQEIEAFHRTQTGLFGKPKGPAIRRAIAWSWIIMAITLLLVIGLQVYSIFGTGILKELEARSTQMEQVRREESQIRATNPDASEEAMPLKDILSRKATLDAHLSAHESMLDVWNSFWRKPFVWGFEFFLGESKPPTDKTALFVANKQYAQAMLQAISLYLLPLLYGLLGASVFVLRRIGSELEESSFSPSNPYRYRLRYALGAVLGATAGLIFDPTDIGTPESPVQLAAFAFVAGFSVEAVFSQLDSIVAGWRKKVGERSSQTSA